MSMFNSGYNTGYQQLDEESAPVTSGAIKQNIKNLMNQNAKIRHQIRLIGVPGQDSEEFRVKLNALSNSCFNLISKLEKQLNAFARHSLSNPQTHSFQVDTFNNDLENATNDAEENARVLRTTIEANPLATYSNTIDPHKSLGFASGSTHSAPNDARLSKAHNLGLKYHAEREAENRRVQAQITRNDMVLYEKTEEIQRIGQDVQHVHGIIQNISSMVDEQGVHVQTLADAAQDTRDATRGGMDQTLLANKGQKKYRNKICIFLLIVVLIATVLALALSHVI